VAIGDVPSELAPDQDPNQTAWRLEVQGSAGGQQQGFVDRLRYLDSLKVRGMLLPERAIGESPNTNQPPRRGHAEAVYTRQRRIRVLRDHGQQLRDLPFSL
jgi:hypothetical protein